MRPPCTSSQGSTFGCPPIRPVRSEPAWSSPTTEMNATAAPSAVRLRTTLPAPPGIASSRSTRQDRDRGLRADPIDCAVYVAVQHHVADHQDAGAAEQAHVPRIQLGAGSASAFMEMP